LRIIKEQEAKLKKIFAKRPSKDLRSHFKCLFLERGSGMLLPINFDIMSANHLNIGLMMKCKSKTARKGPPKAKSFKFSLKYLTIQNFPPGKNDK